jgi:hypothetical protein
MPYLHKWHESLHWQHSLRWAYPMTRSTNRSTRKGLASDHPLLCVTSLRELHPLCDQADRHGADGFKTSGKTVITWVNARTRND